MDRLKKLFKFLIGAAVFLSLFLFAIYSLMWYLLARNMQSHIDLAWNDIHQNERITISGEKPVVTGYPMPPEINFSGDIIFDSSIAISIPRLHFWGFPLSGLTIYIEATDGLVVSDTHSKKGVSIDFAAINVTLPEHPPLQAKYDVLKRWQAIDDPLILNGFSIQSGDVDIKGRGLVGLDPDLQIDVKIESRISGMDQLFEKLEQDNLVKAKSLSVARNFLNMVGQKDSETGKIFFDTGFYIQQRGVFIGPMRVYEVPEIIWDGTPDIPRVISRKNMTAE